MNRTLKIAAFAAALLVAVSFSAMAVVSTPSNPGRIVAKTQEFRDYFDARGVNPAYLGMDRSAVPATAWAKMEAVLNTANGLWLSVHGMTSVTASGREVDVLFVNRV